MIVRARPNINQSVLLKCITAYDDLIDTVDNNIYFFNSGSSALLFFLNLFGKNKRIGVQVFTCSTVLDTIIQAEDTPVFMDIDKNYFTTTYDIIKEVINSIDILILSHLFGIPNPDYILIKNLCQQKGVILIDDLCQTYHAKIGNDYIEDLSENYFYSFFYDKPITSGCGGMLKLSNCFTSKANEIFHKISKESPQKGKQKLRSLYWMYHLLSPDIYNKDFRNNSLWNYFLLSHYPISWPIKPLNILLKSRIGKAFCKLRLIVPKEKIKRMSDIQIRYTLNQMHSFTNNNTTFIQLCNRYNIKLPQYMCNKNISCSLGKRAICNNTPTINNEVEIGLYNWPYLLSSDYKTYPIASSILKEYVNIPIWHKDL